jgi:hypothetical protein
MLSHEECWVGMGVDLLVFSEHSMLGEFGGGMGGQPGQIVS